MLSEDKVVCMPFVANFKILSPRFALRSIKLQLIFSAPDVRTNKTFFFLRRLNNDPTCRAQSFIPGQTSLQQEHCTRASNVGENESELHATSVQSLIRNRKVTRVQPDQHR